MSTTEKRLTKIETALTPKEAVVAWMTEAHAHGSLYAYVQMLQDAPAQAYPLVRLGEQMEAAVRGALRGQPEQEVWRKVRLTVRDASFLYFLSSNLNQRCMEHKRANWLHIALVSELLKAAIEGESPRRLVVWWEQAKAAAHTAYLQRGVIEAAAARYYDGVTPLYPEIAADVAAQVAEIERLVGIFTELMDLLPQSKRKRKRAQEAEPSTEPMDLAYVRVQAEATVPAELQYVVDLSKAEALRFIGEGDEAHRLMGRYVWRTEGP